MGWIIGIAIGLLVVVYIFTWSLCIVAKSADEALGYVDEDCIKEDQS